MKSFLSLSFLWSILILTSITGCTKEKQKTMPAPPPPVVPPIAFSDSNLKYLALGDSYTIGQNVRESERFPYFTAALLREQKIMVNEPRYIARTGWSTMALQEAIAAAEPLGVFDFVTLLIGVNDQYQRLDTGGYRTRFTQLLQKAVSLAGDRKARVFVLSIPDYSATPFVSEANKPQVSREIDYFNAINKQITLAQGISYTDITPSTREAATDPGLLADDGLHYSPKEHKRWADKIVPLIKAAIK